MRKVRDYVATRIGRLQPMWPAGRKKSAIVWLCCCDCGNFTLVGSSDLGPNHTTRSCGCLYRETRKTINRTHGHSSGGLQTPEYSIWKAMMQRCTNPRNQDFELYGGRGIKVCEHWKSFENFFADVGPRPHPKLTIDRKNNDGDYEPSNFRWATQSEQAYNRRPKQINRV